MALASAILCCATMLAAQPAATAPTQPASATAATWPAAPADARIVAEGWFAPIAPDTKPPALPATITKAFVIPIHDEITETTADVVRRKITRCRMSGAQLVIFDMKTPGGSGHAMDEITQLITKELGDIYTVAFVNNRAFSAGAVISLACNEIDITPTGIIGDAMPIMIGSEGLQPIPEKERGKLESAIRGEVRVLAKRNGYNIDMCEAMITITIELWMIRNRQTGEVRVVNEQEWQGKVKNLPPGKAPATQPVDAASPWEYLQTVDGPNSLVTMTADEATKYGFAKHVFKDSAELEKYFHLEHEPVVLENNWSELLVEWLTSATVVSILVLVGILGLYMEFQAPGHIVPGVIGVICFAIVFGSRYLVGMSDWWQIALFILGLLLIALELFVFSGHMVFAISGIICCISALLLLFVPNLPGLPMPRTELDWTVFTHGIAAVGLGLLGGLIGAAVLAQFLPRVPVASALVLPPVQAPEIPPVAPQSPLLKIKVGDVGVVTSMCRPVGKVRFGEDLLDASSEGDIIETGTKVRVLRADANHLIVERA